MRSEECGVWSVEWKKSRLARIIRQAAVFPVLFLLEDRQKPAPTLLLSFPLQTAGGNFFVLFSLSHIWSTGKTCSGSVFVTFSSEYRRNLFRLCFYRPLFRGQAKPVPVLFSSPTLYVAAEKSSGFYFSFESF